MSIRMDDYMDVSMTKLEAANKVLGYFAHKAKILVEKNRYRVEWEIGDKKYNKEWRSLKGQDFYPVWYRKWSHGGTATIALSQLIRWLKNKPVLPLTTWKYWAGPNVSLLSQEMVEILRESNYPEKASCVLCGRTLDGRLDWWHLDSVSGPACIWTDGCRQKGSDPAG